MEDVGILPIWPFGIQYILLPFGRFYGYLVDFIRFGMLYQEKSGNPAPSVRVVFAQKGGKIDGVKTKSPLCDVITGKTVNALL
jgi:hypothetical protein